MMLALDNLKAKATARPIALTSIEKRRKLRILPWVNPIDSVPLKILAGQRLYHHCINKKNEQQALVLSLVFAH
jgi:hypothetical protein